MTHLPCMGENSSLRETGFFLHLCKAVWVEEGKLGLSPFLETTSDIPGDAMPYSQSPRRPEGRRGPDGLGK